jgi:hypothetical protein
MTAFFVKKFKKGLKCSSCKKETINGYKLCVTHLIRAKERFARWSEERRACGKCIRCDRKGYNGYLRCKTHTIKNRQQCLAWMDKHPNQNHEQWLILKQRVDAGICVCPARNKLSNGFRRCADCRVRKQGYRTKEKTNETRV